MVFSFLVVPAVIAFLFTRDMRRLAYIAWGSGALASILGLWLSLAGDLPTGPLIVCMYGVVLVGAIALRRVAGATGWTDGGRLPGERSGSSPLPCSSASRAPP